MSTYLSLCQEVAREGGTVPTIGNPTAVTAQTGRLARIVEWVDTAWQMIQTDRSDWRWMNADFSGTTSSGTRSYAASAMGIASRFGHWIYEGEELDNLFSVYETALGQDDEGLMTFIEWDKFRRLCLVGPAASVTGKPIYVTIDDAENLQFYPEPDDTYTIRGRYHKSPQTLSADGDTPEMPAEFHRAIAYRALMLQAQHDEAYDNLKVWSMEYDRVMDRLRTHQLPRIRTAKALA